MKRMSLLGLALFLLTPALLSAQAPDLSGPWNLTFETPRGEQTFAVMLTHTAEEVGGTLTLPRGDETELQDASFVDGVLSFAVQLGMGQRSMTQRFEGRLEGETITGEMQRDGGPPAGGRGGARGGQRGGQGGAQQGPGPRDFTMVRAGS